MDLNLHNLVGLRVIEAKPDDVKNIARDFELFESPLEGEPDIVIRFVPHLTSSTPIRYVQMDKTGFADDMFFMVSGDAKKIVLPFEQLGTPCEIVCETGTRHIPQLSAVVNLAALAKGVIPLHASAFSYQGVGTLVAGFPLGGKTSALLAFWAKGAQPISDDWTFVTQNQIYGIPAPITVRDWQLGQLPMLRKKVKRSDQWQLRGIRTFVSLEESMLPGKVFRKAAKLLSRKLHVEIPAGELFEARPASLISPLNRAFLIMSHDSPKIEVHPLDIDTFLEHLWLIQQDDWQDFIACYHDFRFAFPDKNNLFVEQLATTYKTLLRQKLSETPAFIVYHPHPVPLDELFAIMSPYEVSNP
jgi:hypothetical protein